MKQDFFSTVPELVEASRAHERYRGVECICIHANLIASEGLKSTAVREMPRLSQDLEYKYAEGQNDLEGHVKLRYYEGQKYIAKIDNCSADLVKDSFGCNGVDGSLGSGTHTNLARADSAAAKNKRMVVASLSCGPHLSHDYMRARKALTSFFHFQTDI